MKYSIKFAYFNQVINKIIKIKYVIKAKDNNFKTEPF